MVIALIPDGVEVKKTWWPSSGIDVARWNNWQMCLESFDANTAIWRVEAWFEKSADSDSNRPIQIGIGRDRSDFCPILKVMRFAQQKSDEQ